MLDAQPGAVVADGGAAARFLESAAGVGVQPLPVAAAEQARFRVDDVFPTHAEAAQADIVGAGAVSEAERGIGTQRGADEAREIDAFPTVRALTGDVGEAGQGFARAVCVVQRDRAGITQFVVVRQGRCQRFDLRQRACRALRPGQNARPLLSGSRAVAETLAIGLQHVQRARSRRAR